MYAAQPGEVLELYLLRQGRQISVLRMPESARSIPPGSGARIESRADGVWVVAYAQVAKQETGTGGTVAIAMPVELAGIERRIAEDALDATLLGLGSAIELVTSPAPRTGRPLTIPLPPLAELDTRNLTLTATIAPVTRGRTFRKTSYACFGIAGLLLLGSIAARRRRVVIEEP